MYLWINNTSRILIQVVDILISAMRTSESIEMYVINGSSSDAYSSTIETHKKTSAAHLLTSNNNNSPATTKDVLSDTCFDKNTVIGQLNNASEQTPSKCYSNLYNQWKHWSKIANDDLQEGTSILTTGFNKQYILFIC